MVVSGRKQQKVNWAVAALQREGLGMTGTLCHTGKGEDWEGLVLTELHLSFVGLVSRLRG